MTTMRGNMAVFPETKNVVDLPEAIKTTFMW